MSWYQKQEQTYGFRTSADLFCVNPTSLSHLSPFPLYCKHAAAVKHGTKEQAGGGRWKYTYEGVVYITTNDSMHEITSWRLRPPIPKAPLDTEHYDEQNTAKRRLLERPHTCTSHTVIVVDHSGSMRTSDVPCSPNRAKAVFETLAVEFVAKQRIMGDATETDVVSLILMDDKASIIFDREPIGIVLYNMFVQLQRSVKPRSHGNFTPAITLAEELLRVDSGNPRCALCLLFLSDGRPSDMATGVLPPNRCIKDVIAEKVGRLANAFKKRLSINTFGFGPKEEDFPILKEMSKVAKDAGALGEFHRPQLSVDQLRSAIGRSVSSLTSTRSRLTTLASNERRPRVMRRVEREAAQGIIPCTSALTGSEDGWIVIPCNVKRFEFSPLATDEGNPWLRVPFSSEHATGIAIRQKSFGEGAERLVYRFQVCSLKGCDASTQPRGL